MTANGGLQKYLECNLVFKMKVSFLQDLMNSESLGFNLRRGGRVIKPVMKKMYYHY